LFSRFSGKFATVAEMGSQKSPRVMNTYEVIEHYQSGTVTRNCPRLVEASPEAFVMISLLPVQSNTAIMQAGSALLISK
jgi:formate dehydrogenase major subunit